MYDCCTHAALSFTFVIFYPLAANFISFFFFPFSVGISSVCSSQQFRNTQCCWTGQRHRRAGEEQDGEIEIINKTHTPNVCTKNKSDRFMYKHTHFSGVVDREWHHGLLFIWQDCDSLCQLSIVSTKGHCTLANIPNTSLHTIQYRRMLKYR